MNVLYVEGAYGRRYATGEAATKDWKEGKDFKIVNGPYCSSRDDFTIFGYTAVMCSFRPVAKIGTQNVTLWRAGH